MHVHISSATIVSIFWMTFFLPSHFALADTAADFKEAWAAIKGIEVKQFPPDSPEAAEEWADLSTKAFAIHKGMCNKYTPAEWTTFLVGKFGEDGAKADFRILMIAPSHTFPRSTSPVTEATNDSDASKERGLCWCKAICERAKADSEFLDRYYRVCLWSESLFVAGKGRFFRSAVISCSDYFSKEPEKRDAIYWWQVRNFIILLKATNREDVLSKLELDDLDNVKESFLEWEKRLRQPNGMLILGDDKQSWKFLKNDSNKLIPEIPPLLNVGRKIPMLKIPDRPFKGYTAPITSRVLFGIEDYLPR